MLARIEQRPVPERLRRGYRQAGLVSDELPAFVLTRTAARWPNRPAVVDLTDGARIIGYGELAAEVRRFAGFLGACGLGPGDVVVAQVPNRREALVLSWAAFHVGCVLAPVIDIYREHELRTILPAVEPEAVIAIAEHRGERCAERLDAILEECGIAPRARVVVDGEVTGWTPWAQAVAGATAAGPVAHHPDAAMLVLFTSGTTSAPKGAVHSARTLMAESRQLALSFGVTWRDRVHDAYPLAHIAGLEYATTISALTGSCVLLSRMRGQAAAVQEIVEFGATYAAGPTGMVPLLAEAFARTGVERVPLHTFVCGGSTVPRELIEQAEEVGIGAMRVYGLTEQPSVTAPCAADPASDRYETDGPIAPGAECEAVDPATREPLGRGAEGELRVRGPERMLGYLDAGESRSQIDEAGWFYTGDLGVVDERGCVTINGRLKDIINRGGEKFSARDIEDVLVAHPLVAEAAVVAAPDSRYGEVPAAFVVAAEDGASPSAEELAGFLAERGLSRQKTPVHWRVLEALPATPFGKVKKVELRALLERDGP